MIEEREVRLRMVLHCEGEADTLEQDVSLEALSRPRI